MPSLLLPRLCLPFNSGPSSESVFPSASLHPPHHTHCPPGPAASGVLWSGDSAKGVGGARPSLCQPPRQVGEGRQHGREGYLEGQTKKSIGRHHLVPRALVPRTEVTPMPGVRGGGGWGADLERMGSQGQPCLCVLGSGGKPGRWKVQVFDP